MRHWECALWRLPDLAFVVLMIHTNFNEFGVRPTGGGEGSFVSTSFSVLTPLDHNNNQSLIKPTNKRFS